MPRGVRAGLAVLFVVACLPGTVLGQEAGQPVGQGGNPWAAQQRLDDERRQLAQQYDESLALEADLVSAWEASRARVALLATEIAGLDQRLTATSLRLREAELRLDDAEASVRSTEASAADARVEAERSRDALRTSAVAAYVANGELSGLSGWGRLANQEDIALSMFYARHLNRLREVRVAEHLEQRARAERLVNRAASARLEAQRARDGVDREKAEIEALRAGRVEARRAAEVEETQQATLVTQVRAQASGYQERLRVLEAESAQIAELIRRAAERAAAEEAVSRAALANPARDRAATVAGGAPQAGRPSQTSRTRATAAPAASPTPPPRPSATTAPAAPPPRPTPAPTPAPTSPRTTTNAGAGPPPQTSVSLRYPLPGYPVVSGYGWRIHPILGVRKLHEGIDIWAPMGQSVQAAGSGTVIWAAARNGFGNCVIIDHGSGISTLYAHLSAFSVSAGQSVGSGETVGQVGATGLASGPHLHFEVRVGGRSYDPLAYVTPR